MSINQLIFQNLKANLKHYYLYVIALMFSVALYFAFVTLQYDPALDSAKGDIKGAAGLKAASVLLIAIVAVFNLYANNIFVKRRGKEIGLLQLIGLTKGRIFRLLGAENFVLYFGSLLAGTFLGFSCSKLMLMILFAITGVDARAALHFSAPAFIQTLVVFSAIFVFIMAVNYLFIKRQSILSLFRTTSSAEVKISRISAGEIVMGLLGIALIAFGYYMSSRLFTGEVTSVTMLFLNMILILGSVIIGSYLFYKGSVRFLLNAIRKRKNGFLNVQEVLSLSSVMFRMKTNALLLTVITTVSALAIGLLSLSYISYYSAEKTAELSVPNHFSFGNAEDAAKFKQALDADAIKYEEVAIPIVQMNVDITGIMSNPMNLLSADSSETQLAVISEKSTPDVELEAGKTVLTGSSDLLSKFLDLKSNGEVKLHGKQTVIPLDYDGLHKRSYVSSYFSSGGLPVLIVDDAVFQRVQQDLDAEIQRGSLVYTGFDIENTEQLTAADQAFDKMGLKDAHPNDSRIDVVSNQKNMMGLVMFIVGFLGLTFLITSGCILYFKQMDECEEERPSYAILRKLGFTQGDLLRGIQRKQLFNFGIPLVVGLFHSYFAVQSGWFLFGSELWTPMFIVMALYTVLYSIFGILSVLHYRRVIRQAL